MQMTNSEAIMNESARLSLCSQADSCCRTGLFEMWVPVLESVIVVEYLQSAQIVLILLVNPKEDAKDCLIPP